MANFDSPLRRIERLVHLLDDATQELFETVREDDEATYGAASNLMSRLEGVLSLTQQRIEAVAKKHSVISFARAAVDNDRVAEDDKDQFLTLARCARFDAAFERSVEIKPSVSDHFSVTVVELGAAQLFYRNCRNNVLHRDEFIFARPAGQEIVFTGEWRNQGDRFRFLIQVQYYRLLPDWLVLSLHGEQTKREHQVDFDSIDLAPLRAMVGDSVVGLSDDSLRLLVKILVLPSYKLEDEEDLDTDGLPLTAEDFPPLPPRITAGARGDRLFPFDDLVELCLAMHSLVPATVAFEIFEFLPGFRRATRFAKMRTIESTYNSIKKVATQRVAAASKKRAFSQTAASEQD